MPDRIDGPFAVARNAMIITSAGLAPMVPEAFVVLVVAGRAAGARRGEPCPPAVHRDAYQGHAARADRFVPGIDQLRSGRTAAYLQEPHGFDRIAPSGEFVQ
ncbi:hypothetical protein [Nonomuraea sp. NPDC049695]|uniref:hypothetical protein n=1 Tax=Nonomuraea sp. NPDC049695 TaxID=3154734 RepID=UPI00344797FC